MNNPIQETAMLFDMDFDEKKEKAGAYQISIVDKPAIIAQYMAFHEMQQHSFHFIETSQQRRIFTGPVMIPEMPIKRIDETGEVTGTIGTVFYVKARKEVVERSAFHFMQEGSRLGNLMHLSKLYQDIKVVNSWCTDSQMGILKPRDYKECPDNTWFVSLKVDNDEAYEKFKQGGFSLEGNFILKPVGKKPIPVLAGLEKILGNRNK